MLTRLRIFKFVGALLSIATVLGLGAPSVAQENRLRELTIDDVMSIEEIDKATISPDGARVAIAMRGARSVTSGLGRDSFDIDPRTSKIVVYQSSTKRSVEVEPDERSAEWCPIWNPAGDKLAFLRLVDGSSPVLSIWDADARTMVDVVPVVTQSRNGRSRVAVSGPTNQGTNWERCHTYEGSPFAWTDDSHLIVLVPGQDDDLPSVTGAHSPRETQTSPVVLDTHPHRPTEARLRTFSVVQVSADSELTTNLGDFPSFPFRGQVVVSANADLSKLVVMAPIGALPPQGQRIAPGPDDARATATRIWTVPLGKKEPTPRSLLPQASPIQFLGWSPDNDRIALRVASSSEPSRTWIELLETDTALPSVTLDGTDLAPADVSPEYLPSSSFRWLDANTFLMNGATPDETDRRNWKLVTIGDGSIRNLEAGGALTSISDSKFALTQDDETTIFEFQDGDAKVVRELEGTVRSMKVSHNEKLGTRLLLARSEANSRWAMIYDVAGDRIDARMKLPVAADIVDLSTDGAVLLLEQDDGTSRRISTRAISNADPLRLDPEIVSTNQHLAAVRWSKPKLLTVKGPDGVDRNALVLLPERAGPGPYPTIFWLYPGYVVRSEDSFFTQRRTGGFYNLHLYTAQGYAVVIPSISIDKNRADPAMQIASQVETAARHVVEAGIADESRMGLLGQSFGGYGVNVVASRSKLFAAAVSIAGISDLNLFFSQFEKATDIADNAHLTSFNAQILMQYLGNRTPVADPGFFVENSPIYDSAAVETPMLLIHGQFDERAQTDQSELLFHHLYLQNKTARLLLFPEENHGVSRSPLNVRAVYDSILEWFDEHLRPIR